MEDVVSTEDIVAYLLKARTVEAEKQPFLGNGPYTRSRGLFFSSVIFFYTDCRTPWTGDQLVARPVPKHRTAQTQNKRTQRHPCFEWDLNPRSQAP
jgi:hypothetical protein